MSDVLREWRDNAPYWDQHADTIRTMFEPVTHALIEEASIVEGYSVLDIAGGTGEPSITIAEFVGLIGQVTCTDAVPEMLVAAQKHSRRRGVNNIRFRQCIPDSLPFETDSFDAVVCRLGAMFFPEPVAALREMVRVLKPERNLALAVWGENQFNPFMFKVTDVLARHIESAPIDPDAPTANRFAEKGKLATLLSEAGATRIAERVLDFQIAAPISREQFWELRATTSGTLREKLSTLTPEKQEQIRQEVIESVEEFFPDGQMSFPAQILIVSGAK